MSFAIAFLADIFRVVCSFPWKNLHTCWSFPSTFNFLSLSLCKSLPECCTKGYTLSDWIRDSLTWISEVLTALLMTCHRRFCSEKSSHWLRLLIPFRLIILNGFPMILLSVMPITFGWFASCFKLTFFIRLTITGTQLVDGSLFSC